ncbi:MAG: cbb3-type cytochrome oxidase assembly protein CcoS [Flavobacteriales bacterium]
MSVLFILIIISLIVAASFLIAFIWSVKNGQYEDGYTPSVRILFDDELLTKEKKSTITNNNNLTKK